LPSVCRARLPARYSSGTRRPFSRKVTEGVLSDTPRRSEGTGPTSAACPRPLLRQAASPCGCGPRARAEYGDGGPGKERGGGRRPVGRLKVISVAGKEATAMPDAPKSVTLINMRAKRRTRSGIPAKSAGEHG